MQPPKNDECGLSLVEVTIMLLVLMLLTGVLAPSIFDFVHDAQWVKVKGDCEAIGLTVERLTRDVGPCIKFNGNESCTKNNRVELLHSDGPAVDEQSLGSSATSVNNRNLKHGRLNWNSDSSDSMENQFVTNGSGYPTPRGSTLGPLFWLGWRGAYLSPPIGSDPWGHRYLVNSAFLAVTSDSSSFDMRAEPCGDDEGRRRGNCSDRGGEGSISGGWSYDIFCISSGPNGVYETPIGGNGHGGVTRMGDDFIYIISGGTR